MVGIGGYARLYVERLLQGDLPEVRIAAVVDPAAASTPHWPELERAGVPKFDTLADFLASGIDVDLAVVSTPIALHTEHTCALLSVGIHVLCEKPMAATLEDARKMQTARDASGTFLEIGYQWSFSDAVRSLKADILADTFGAPKRLATRVAWPRTRWYYSRNAWAGCKHDPRGRPVFDSPANNATAHYLHNMLFLLGPSMTEAVMPTAITAECYRANPIENFDAVCCRIETREGPELLFFSAHCVDIHSDPVCRFEFEEAVVTMKDSLEFVAHFRDGREIRYGDPNEHHMRKLEVCIDHVRLGGAVKAYCGPEAAMAQVQCIGAMQEVPILDFEPSQIRQKVWEDSEMLTYVPGLADAMRSGFEQGRLFSELDLPWAGPAKRVVLPGAYSDAGLSTLTKRTEGC